MEWFGYDPRGTREVLGTARGIWRDSGQNWRGEIVCRVPGRLKVIMRGKLRTFCAVS